jgi:hypothetical protein
MKVLMKLAIVVLATGAACALADTPRSGAPAVPSSYAPQGQSRQRVYGAPIQPPIVKKSRARRRAHPAHTANYAAERKARAAAAQKAKANLEYRRAHPAVSNGP